MGFLKLLFNANNAEGIREAMRMAYRKHRRAAERGDLKSDFSPHVAALLGAMGSRMAVNNIPITPTGLWHEVAPFALIDDHEVAVEALAEYAVYVERTVDTKLEGLRETINLWLGRASPDDDLMKLVRNPVARNCRWWDLLQPDVVERLKSIGGSAPLGRDAGSPSTGWKEEELQEALSAVRRAESVDPDRYPIPDQILRAGVQARIAGAGHQFASEKDLGDAVRQMWMHWILLARAAEKRQPVRAQTAAELTEQYQWTHGSPTTDPQRRRCQGWVAAMLEIQKQFFQRDTQVVGGLLGFRDSDELQDAMALAAKAGINPTQSRFHYQFLVDAYGRSAVTQVAKLIRSGHFERRFPDHTIEGALDQVAADEDEGEGDQPQDSEPYVSPPLRARAPGICPVCSRDILQSTEAGAWDGIGENGMPTGGALYVAQCTRCSLTLRAAGPYGAGVKSLKWALHPDDVT